MRRCPRLACCAIGSFTRSQWAAPTSIGRRSRSVHVRTRVLRISDMTRRARRREGGVPRHGFPLSARAIALALLMLARARPACAIDFYEIQIYQVETTPYHRLTL